MKRIIVLTLMVLLLAGSALAYDINIPHPSSWYYPGKYMGDFDGDPLLKANSRFTPGGSYSGGSYYSGRSSVRRYSTYGRTSSRSSSNYDRSYRFGYYQNYDRVKFLGYDRYGRKVYSTRY